MKRVILFFGSFDPLHLGHISIIENAIKKVNADCLYIGLNKNSKKGQLTSFFHRKKMLDSYIKNHDNIKLLKFSFDYNNIDNTYNKIFSLINKEDDVYILIGEDQIDTLDNWYKLDFLIKKVIFIIANRNLDKEYHKINYISLNHDYPDISSSIIKKGNYDYTTKEITEYIKEHNLYLKDKIKGYLDSNRYLHTLSVAKTALKINKLANLGLNPYKVEKAALLHDIAKNMNYGTAIKLLNKYYKLHINEETEVIHQYLGEYLAKNDFGVEDEDILNAIKYHTTGRENMSVLEKLIYVSDKIEPTRKYDTTKMINDCINDFDNGFIIVLKHNKLYLEQNKDITNQNTLSCFKYYL